jgi:hypothetical protein
LVQVLLEGDGDEVMPRHTIQSRDERGIALELDLVISRADEQRRPGHVGAQRLVLEVPTDQAELVRKALLRWGEPASTGGYTVPAGDGRLISVRVVDTGADLEGMRRRLAVMRVEHCHPLEALARPFDAELYERMLAVRAALEHAENRVMDIEVQNRDLTRRLKQP